MNRVARPLRLIGLVTVLSLAAAACSAGGAGGGYAAKVGGTAISDRQFRRELDELRSNKLLVQSFQQQLGKSQKGTVPSSLAGAWLSRLIQQEVIDREFDRRHLRVSAADLERARQLNAQQFQSAQVFDAFDRWFRDRQLRRDARFLRTIDAVGGAFSEADLRARYEKSKAQFAQACAEHILVPTKAEADAIKAQLDGGADFAALAKAQSKDPGSAAQGGKLGCQPKGAYVGPFDAAVWSLPLNTFSAPVQTQFGFHVIRVTERKTATFEEARSQLLSQLQNLAQQRFGQFLLRQLQRADISVNPKYGSFAIGQTGPQIVPPQAPSPSDGPPKAQPGVPTLEGLFPQQPAG